MLLRTCITGLSRPLNVAQITMYARSYHVYARPYERPGGCAAPAGGPAASTPIARIGSSTPRWTSSPITGCAAPPIG